MTWLKNALVWHGWSSRKIVKILELKSCFYSSHLQRVGTIHNPIFQVALCCGGCIEPACVGSPAFLWNLSASCCCSLCADARDSIAKVAYGRVFGWIVCKINELLAENVDPEVELREIGEFYFPCSCSVLECASLSHNKGQAQHEVSQSLRAGVYYQNCDPAGDKSQQQKSVGLCLTLSSWLIWSSCEPVVLGHCGLAEKSSWCGSSLN